MDKASSCSSGDAVSQPGVFISFEGTDGVGKSTQIKELRRRIQRVTQDVLLTREPGGTMLGEDIRRILQEAPDSTRITPEAELLLFAASRIQLVIDVLTPALAKGTHVIADRFFDSTTVYQGMGRGLERSMVDLINQFAVRDCRPDITFLLDMDSAVARSRVAKRQGEPGGDRMERQKPEFFERIRAGYLELAAAEPQRFVTIDATQTMGAIADEIWNNLQSRFDGVFG